VSGRRAGPRARRGEFALVEAFTAALPREGPGVVLGPGDDAAVLRAPAGEDLVATVDAVVERVHFSLPPFTPEDLGWKALAVNLSDLAAMGARPLWALVALGVPAGTPAGTLAGIARGLGACARAHGCAVAGGNVTRAGELSVTVTALGAVRRGKALTRSGARPGDLLVVSGTLGDAALGLRPGAPAEVAARQRRPAPRVGLGRELARFASAAIDVSDGLVQDVGHLCAASGVAARIDAERIPRSRAGAAFAARLADPLGPALAGGEDYELAVTVAPHRLAAVQRAGLREGVPIAVVGRIASGHGVEVVDGRGRPIPVPPGHDHLRPRPRTLTGRAGGLGSARRAPGDPARARTRR
jgi:thiamine-monophosphate kinase